MFAKQLLSLSLLFTWVLPSLAFPYEALDFAEEGIVAELRKGVEARSNTNLPPFTAKTWPYQRPVKDASRTPCPLANAVANHGFVARDGKNVSIEEMTDALVISLNLERPFARLIVRSTLLMGSLITNTTTDEYRFDLSDVNIHGSDEHDASLGRYDLKVGDNIYVSPVRVANALRDTRPVEAQYIDTTSLARTRIRVEAESKAVGSPLLAPFIPVAGAAEAGFILMVIGTPGSSGDPTDRPARKDKVWTWMTQERFPFELGWSRSKTVLTMAGTHGPLMQKVLNIRADMLNGTFTGSE